MKFKYFVSADKFGSYLDGNTQCDLCGTETRCFDASLFIGEDEMDAICPGCLAAGELKDMDLYTCEGDIAELRKQLKELNPSATETEIEQLITQKTEELEKTTPALVTWQDWEWPVADGDYCAFIGYGSRPLYNQLAKDKDGKKFFKYSLYSSFTDSSNADELWDESMPGKLIRNGNEAEGLSPLFYVFRSLHSEKIVTVWDID